MKVKDIAKLVGELVCDDEGVAQLKACNYNEPCAKRLLYAVITGLQDLSAEGFPFIVTEVVTAENGVIDNGKFSFSPVTIKSVVKCGKPQDYGYCVSGLKVEQDGDYYVTYSAEPEYNSPNDKIYFGCEKSMVCYISCRNYCVQSRRYDEAEMWDGLFSRHAESVRLSKNYHIKVGKWV